MRKSIACNQLSGVKLFIFDLDGTLINAYEAIIKSFNYTLGMLGLTPRSPATIIRSIGWGDINLLKPFVKKQQLDKAIAIYRKHHQHTLRQSSRLMPGARNLLSFLKKQNYLLAVASNRPTRFSRILIRHLSLSAYFDYVLCADKVKEGKPHPELLRRIMRHVHARASETAFVGDMAIDVQAGNRAKVVTIAITSGSSNKRGISQAQPCLSVSSLKELLRILKARET